MEKKYSVSSTNVIDSKTTNITIKTESEGLMRKMLGLSAKEKNKESNEKQSSKASEKKKSGKSTTTKKSKEPSKLIAEPKQQLKQVKPKKLEPVKKQKKVLPEPKTTSQRKKLNRTSVKQNNVKLPHKYNLDERLVSVANGNSFYNKGTILKKEYENKRKMIEFSGISNSKKNELLKKLDNLYQKNLRYESQYVPVMVAGPARYPYEKMDRIWNKIGETSSEIVEWWKQVEPALIESTKSKKQLSKQKDKLKEEKIKKIKENFDLWYGRALKDVEKCQGKGLNMRYTSNAAMALSYVNEALEVDTKLYKELFEKLNKIVNYRKNTNDYKVYKSVIDGEITNESIKKQDEINNQVIFKNADYEIKNITIKAGKRIAIKFTFFPKPQLKYALKSRGYVWYSFENCFLIKPEKFDLEWAKNISNQYKKYL